MKFLFVIIALVLISPSLFALKLPHLASDLEPDPAVTYGRLDNGMLYAIMPHEEPPERVSLRLFVRAGSLHETDRQMGLAHYLEHMAFNGSKHYPPGELVEYLQRIGMSFGADTNAHTSFDETVYKLELPENTETYLREGLKVMSDYAARLTLLEDEVERERGVILSEIRHRDSVSYRAFKANWGFLLQGTRLPERWVLGTVDSVNALQQSDFKAFYQKWYQPDNMALVVVGDVRVDAVTALIEQAFADIAAPQTPTPGMPDLGVIASPGLAVKLHTDMEAPSVEIDIVSVMPYAKGPDSVQNRLDSIRANLVNRMLNRRFERLADDENAPFSSASAYTFDYLRMMDMTGLSITCVPDNWEVALALGEQTLRQAIAFGFSQAELDESKAVLLRLADQAVEAAPTRKAKTLSSRIADALSNERVFLSPEASRDLMQLAFEGFSPEAAHQKLQTLWADEDRFLYVGGNLELEDPEATLRDLWQQSQATPVEAEEATELKPWAYETIGEPSAVVSSTYHDDLDLHQHTLANNVRVNIKSTDFESGRVRVLVAFGNGGLSLHPEIAGLDLLASAAMVDGGLKANSNEAIKRLMAGKTVSLNFSVQEGAFHLSGVTSPNDLATQLQWMAAMLKEPGFRPEGVRQARRQFEKFYKQLDTTPNGVMQDEVARFLAGGDFRKGFAPLDTVMAYDCDALRAWLESPMRTSHLEVSLVGDIDPDSALEAIRSTFGALPERDAEQPELSARRQISFPRQARAVSWRFPSEIDKAIAVVFWPTTDMRDVHKARRLSLASRVFDDRLRKTVREALGEGYSPYATHRPSDTYTDYGYAMGINIVSTDKAQAIADMIREIGGSLVTEPITEDEFTRAIEPTKSFLVEYVRNNNYWLNRVLAGSHWRPEQLDWARSIVSDYAAMTVEEVNDIAAMYFNEADALTVIITPQL